MFDAEIVKLNFALKCLGFRKGGQIGLRRFSPFFYLQKA